MEYKSRVGSYTMFWQLSSNTGECGLLLQRIVEDYHSFVVRIRCECELRIIRIQFAADLSELANSRICEFNLVKLNGLVSYLIAHNHAGEFIEFYSEFERIANNSLIRQFATSELANCKTMPISIM